MKRTPFLCMLLSVYVTTAAQNNESSDASFKAFLPTWEQAVTRFVNGDPSLWKQICSHSDDATIFGGFGGFEKGWKEVGPRYDWAATQFKESGGRVQVEYINVVVSGDLAYIVVLERGILRMGNNEKAVPHALRATQIFRKEAGSWKLVHRHADALMDKKAPALISSK